MSLGAIDILRAIGQNETTNHEKRLQKRWSSQIPTKISKGPVAEAL